MMLVPDDSEVWRCRLELSGGEESLLNSFFITSDDADDAGVSGGGALLLEDCFLGLDPILSDEESCVFCAAI